MINACKARRKQEQWTVFYHRGKIASWTRQIQTPNQANKTVLFTIGLLTSSEGCCYWNNRVCVKPAGHWFSVWIFTLICQKALDAVMDIDRKVNNLFVVSKNLGESRSTSECVKGLHSQTGPGHQMFIGRVKLHVWWITPSCVELLGHTNGSLHPPPHFVYTHSLTWVVS